MKKIIIAIVCIFAIQFNANATTVITYYPATTISTSAINLAPNTIVYTRNHIPLSYSIGIGGIYFSNYHHRYYKHYPRKRHYISPHHKRHGHRHHHR